MGDDEFDGLAGRVSQVNGRCDAARGKAMRSSLPGPTSTCSARSRR
jgi:hypothetical protein